MKIERDMEREQEYGLSRYDFDKFILDVTRTLRTKSECRMHLKFDDGGLSPKERGILQYIIGLCNQVLLQMDSERREAAQQVRE